MVLIVWLFPNDQGLPCEQFQRRADATLIPLQDELEELSGALSLHASGLVSDQFVTNTADVVGANIVTASRDMEGLGTPPGDLAPQAEQVTDALDDLGASVAAVSSEVRSPQPAPRTESEAFARLDAGIDRLASAHQSIQDAC